MIKRGAETVCLILAAAVISLLPAAETVYASEYEGSVYVIPDPEAPYPESGMCGENAYWRIEGDTLIISGSGEMTDYEYDAEGEAAPEGEEPPPVTEPAGKSFDPAPYLPYYHERIRAVIVEEGITKTGTGAFANCYSLESVTLPYSLRTIGEDSFINATSLVSVTVPEGTNRINAAAFAGCTALREVFLPSSLTVIGRSAFASCTSLETLSLPAGIRAVAAYLCEGCTSLKSFTLPPSATGIGIGAFMSCGALSEITIPVSVISIDPFAFFECTGLVAVSYDGSEVQWNAIAIDEWNDELINARNMSLNPGRTRFADVPLNAWYEDAVIWALERNVTSGTGERTFSPNAFCSRAMIVTFLYHALGDPDFTETRSVSDFTDVPENAYYRRALSWAYNGGYVAGVGKGLFGPDAECTRAQIMVMIHGIMGRPDSDTGAMPFTDVPRNSYYAKACAWGFSSGFTAGRTPDTFAPGERLTRAEAVFFARALDNSLN